MCIDELEDWRNSQAMKRSKYGVRTDKAGIEARTVDNIRFDSLKEANRYQELKLLAKAGEINHLNAFKPQLRYSLVVEGVKICTYVADFRYADKDFNLIVEDCKGMKTPVYRMKKKLMKAIYGIEIRET